MGGIKLYFDENRFAQIKLCVNDAKRSHMEVKRYYEKISNKKFDNNVLNKIYKGSIVQFKGVDVNAKDLKAFEFWSSEIRNEKLCVDSVDAGFQFNNKIFKFDSRKDTFIISPEVYQQLKDSCMVFSQTPQELKVYNILQSIKEVLIENRTILDDLRLSKLEWLDKDLFEILRSLYDGKEYEFAHNIKKACQQINVGHKYAVTQRKPPIH